MKHFFYSSVVFRMSNITDPDPDPDVKFVICPGEKSNSEWIIISDLYILHQNKVYKNGNVETSDDGQMLEKSYFNKNKLAY